jgi:hypothetical protein
MATKAMMKQAVSAPAGPATAIPIPLGARIGRVVGLDDDAAPLVDFPGNAHPPARALVALAVTDAMRLSREWREARVLIVFSDQDLRQPVIAGIVSDSLPQACAPGLDLPARLELRAAEELSLQCGEAKILLRSDGKVAVVGREIESRAQQKHRIRGATVAIN